MCKKRETLLYKVSLGFNDLFFTKFKYTEFKREYRRRCLQQGLPVRLELGRRGAAGGSWFCGAAWYCCCGACCW